MAVQIGPVTFREERVLSATECRGFDAFAVELGALEDDGVPYCRHLRAMVARFTGQPEIHQEQWHTFRRGRPAESSTKRYALLETLGAAPSDTDPRLYGALLWLEAPRSGGAIYFPELGARLLPEAGLLALWTLTGAAGEQLEQALAIVEPVLEGNGRALLTWVRSGPARTDPSEEITRELPAVRPRH